MSLKIAFVRSSPDGKEERKEEHIEAEVVDDIRPIESLTHYNKMLEGQKASGETCIGFVSSDGVFSEFLAMLEEQLDPTAKDDFGEIFAAVFEAGRIYGKTGQAADLKVVHMP